MHNHIFYILMSITRYILDLILLFQHFNLYCFYGDLIDDGFADYTLSLLMTGLR